MDRNSVHLLVRPFGAEGSKGLPKGQRVEPVGQMEDVYKD